MLVGLPAHLAPAVMGDSVSRACHAIAATVLAAASVLLIVNQFVSPETLLWPALLSLVPMLVLLVVVARARTTSAHLAYLIVGSAALFWYAVTLVAQVPAVQASDAFSMSLPKIALIMVGSTVVGPRRGLLWSAAGFVLGELTTQLATWQAGGSLRLDVTTLLAFVLVATITGYAEAARGRARRAQPRLHRAALEQQLQGIRLDIERQAAALVHDTVLGHLAAISAASPGELPAATARVMAVDLETLGGGEWLAPPPGTAPEAVAAVDGWERSRLHDVVSRARATGLDVVTTGDVSAVSRLAPAAAEALGLAVGQCLVNVARHSGTDRAEVVVYGDGSELAVMVIDDGVGFDPSAVAADRLGLTNSVHARMARVGGQTQVWSSRGSGTSVVLRVPLPLQQAEPRPRSDDPTASMTLDDGAAV